MDKVFVERKFEELMVLFDNRMCKSDYDLNRVKTEDPRVIRSWPASPGEEVRGPVAPLPDPYPDNVYFRGLNEDQMAQMKYLSNPQPSKAIQANDFDADMNLRKDALLIVHQRDLADEVVSPTKHRARGRKNRFTKAIDVEDHDAEELLVQGIKNGEIPEDALRSPKERNELLDKAAPLEAKRRKAEQR